MKKMKKYAWFLTDYVCLLHNRKCKSKDQNTQLEIETSLNHNGAYEHTSEQIWSNVAMYIADVYQDIFGIILKDHDQNET